MSSALRKGLDHETIWVKNKKMHSYQGEVVTAMLRLDKEQPSC